MCPSISVDERCVKVRFNKSFFMYLSKWEIQTLLISSVDSHVWVFLRDQEVLIWPQNTGKVFISAQAVSENIVSGLLNQTFLQFIVPHDAYISWC